MIDLFATDGGVSWHASSLLRDAGVPHAFSTRIGGVSPAPFDTLNLGNPSGDVQDDWANVHENYRRLQAAADCAGRDRCWVHQVHGGTVASVRKGEPFESGVQADALVSDDASRLLAVRVADCVPVLLSSRDGRVVAAVHAGWRGVIAGVVPNALTAMRMMHPGNVVAAIGPAIGVEAFEVGIEVAEQFSTAFDDERVVRRTGERPHVDLRRAIALQLRAQGLDDSSIDVSDLCTFARPDLFFSHRRDAGVTGRMCAMICPRRET